MHEFLVKQEGGLTKTGRAVINIREYIEQLPDTAAIFKLRDIDGIPKTVSEVFVEFAGAWPLPDEFDAQNTRNRYVNPNYVHARQYSDSLTHCECGAIFTKGYEISDDDGISQEHTEDCLPYHRLRARANVLERRHELIERCTRLGWQGQRLAKRLGVTRNSVGGLARDLDISLTDRRDVYRTEAAETYLTLVRRDGVPAETVADVYGHASNTLLRWAKRFLDYEVDNGVNQFTRTDEGRFTWN